MSTETSSPEITAVRLRGYIDRCNQRKGFGFIKSPGQPDHFLHANEMPDWTPWEVGKPKQNPPSFRVGKYLEFTPAPPETPGRNPRAVKVTVLD